MEKKVFESFCFLQVWLFINILKIDFREDHLIDIVGESIDTINSYYTQYFKIKLV
jgi:hypothetical protein